MPVTKKAPGSVRCIDAAVRAAIMAALCVSGATGAHAADAANAPAATPAEEAAAPTTLEEVTVTATRREESLSKVPISLTAITQAELDSKGIKDIADVARFTPGITVDNSGTNNIAIRGIASSGGAGTTGIYIDDTPIQMRALAFNPDEALPKSFDIERVEVLRGPQGTLFGAGSEGGTVRYITTQPSLTRTSVYSRSEVSFTQGGAPSYEAGVAAGGPLIDDVFGARATVWYRRDGGWIDRVNPTAANPQSSVVDKNANHVETTLVRLAGIWAPASGWTVQPSVYYQDRKIHDASNYWPLYSNPSDDKFVSGNPTVHNEPDKFYLPALKIQADFGSFQLISNTSYFHRENVSGYDGTEYNLGFYQSFGGFVPGVNYPLIDSTGIHLPAAIASYRSPATIDNDQQNFTQEIRLQSSDPAARLLWTTGLFFSSDRQQYLEQIHDPQLEQFTETVFGAPYTDIFSYDDGTGNFIPVPFDPRYPDDSYFLHTHARDKQYALFGEGTYLITDELKLTLGARVSRTEFSFDSETGGPQLFAPNQFSNPSNKETSFTPKVNLSWQMNPNNLFYATYAKGFRPGGGNNPLPQAACAQDFANFGIDKSPESYQSDSVNSFEVGAKNNIDNRIRIASSIYYIRWNNIQQTVVPPVCQISFITNLGKATAKGADLQAEIAVTDAFSMDVTAGYTDARFTQDSAFAHAPNLPPDQIPAPVVRSGDAIVGESGQPGAPVTLSVGAEYKFALAEHESFVRVDFEYQGRNHWLSPRQDAGTAQFSSYNYTLSATKFMSARAGMTLGNWSVEPFVDNLLNTHTVVNYDFTIDPYIDASQPFQALQRQYTFRPRTFGLTATYKY